MAVVYTWIVVFMVLSIILTIGG